MNKQRNRINKKTLMNLAHSKLDEEFGPVEFNSTTPENFGVNYDDEKPKINLNEVKTDEIREKGDWESSLSDLTLARKSKRVKVSTILSNGLTPYELMYGKRDNEDYTEFN